MLDVLHKVFTLAEMKIFLFEAITIFQGAVKITMQDKGLIVNPTEKG